MIVICALLIKLTWALEYFNGLETLIKPPPENEYTHIHEYMKVSTCYMEFFCPFTLT